MNFYIVIILVYLAALTIMNFWKSRQVKSRDDMMVAGRSIPITKMVFTLICTWIGSGTFIAGAEFAAKAGWSALWQVAGVAVGIIIIYFLAAKIRTFGQYTVGDILEVRYGPVARVFGAIAIIISFTTIVSYQFKAGGYILKTITEGKISNEQGMFFAFLFVTIFTMVGGMVAITNTDLPNGIIILTSMIISTPLVIIAAGGFVKMGAVLPSSHMQLFNPEFTYNPPLKIMAIAISTFLLLLGVQSMYQKFYSARNPREARKAAGIWVFGTIFIETVAVVMAIFASVYFWKELQAGTIDHAEVIILAAKRMISPTVGILLLGAATVVVISTGMNYLLSPTTTLIRDIFQRFIRREKKEASGEKLEQAGSLTQPKVISAFFLIAAFFLPWFRGSDFSFKGFQVQKFLTETDVFRNTSGFVGTLFSLILYLVPVLSLLVILMSLFKRSTKYAALLPGILPFAALGILLITSSEALNQMGIGAYLSMIAGLSLIVYRVSEKAGAEKKVVLLQKLMIVLVGVAAYLMATQMRSVLENAYFAYTVYGVAVTPALIAALASKRVTKVAGLISIMLATVVTVFLKAAGYIWPSIMKPMGDPNADPFGIPILYPALAVSLLSLVVISFLTKQPSREVIEKLFPRRRDE